MSSDKDTIYIDIDDEITGIIDKLRTSEGKVVALVLPKRAAVFQSIVNMKLLKRAADADKKNLVLITTEAGLLPLAGAAGVHIAKTLTSKPEIPIGPQPIDDSEDAIQEEDGAPVEAIAAAAAAKPVNDDGVETLVMDDEDLPPEADADVPLSPKTFDPPSDKTKKDSKLRVPNFERFRLLLVLGVLLLILIIGGLFYANYSLAKAAIVVKTDATSVDVALDINLSVAATAVEPSNNTIPAKLMSQQKTYSQQVPTTGQKNNGNKASGSVTVTNCSQDTDATVPAGTGLSSGGNTYISQTAVVVPTSSFNKKSCQNDKPVSISVLAQSAGAAYNIPAGAKFTVAGFSSLAGVGSTLAGGTDSIVQSVNQNDINNAKAKISAANDDAEKQALKSSLQQAGYYAIDTTYQAGAPAVTNSANVGEVANNVTVTETVTYTMFGAHESDLKALIENNVKTQIDTDKQVISDNGLSTASFNVGNISATAAQISLATKATAGPDINAETIKRQSQGKRAGEIKADLKTNPDVTDVQIKLSPFWVTTVPKKPERITVTIAKPTQTAKPSSSNGAKP